MSSQDSPPARSGYTDAPWSRQPWEQELLDRIATRGELKAEELEKRFRERLQLRIAEEHAKLDRMKKKSEEIGSFLREEDFWSEDDDEGRMQQKKSLNPLQQLQILKHRIKLLDRSADSSQLELPSAPSIEEQNFLLLKNLRQSLTQFYEANCPEKIRKVDDVLKIFISQGCSQRAYEDLNYELRIAYGLDLDGKEREDSNFTLYSTIAPEDMPLNPNPVARPPAYFSIPLASEGPPRGDTAHRLWHPSGTDGAVPAPATSSPHLPERRSPAAEPLAIPKPPPDTRAVAASHALPPAEPGAAPLLTVQPPLQPAPGTTPPHAPAVPPPLGERCEPARPGPELDPPFKLAGANGGEGSVEEHGPPSPSWSGNAKLTVRAKWSYRPTHKDDLAFSAGDIIHVRGESDDVPVHWYWGSCKGRKGLLPGNYVDVVKRESRPRPPVVPPPPPAVFRAPPVQMVSSAPSTPSPPPATLRAPPLDSQQPLWVPVTHPATHPAMAIVPVPPNHSAANAMMVQGPLATTTKVSF